jgi:hypothetical protein
MTKEERKQEVERVARELAHLSNWGSMDDFKVFANSLTQEHRTIQQGAFRLMSACIQAWAAMKDDEWYDMRNEATVTISKEIWEKHLKDNGIPYI